MREEGVFDDVLSLFSGELLRVFRGELECILVDYLRSFRFLQGKRVLVFERIRFDEISTMVNQ